MAAEQRHAFGQRQNLMDQAREKISGACEQTQDLVRQNPATSAMITFGLGFCVGMFITSMLAAPDRRQSWYNSFMPEGMSRKQVSDTVTQFVSDAMNKVRAQF